MIKFIYKKYYPFEDYEKRCKHKLNGQYTFSCRKRKDKTTIGSVTCKYFCPHRAGCGTKNGKDWIKCKYLKEALGE